MLTFINRQVFTNTLLPHVMKFIRDHNRFLVDQILIVPKKDQHLSLVETQYNLIQCKELIWILPLNLDDQDIKNTLKLQTQKDLLFDFSCSPPLPMFGMIPHFSSEIKQVHIFFSSM